MIDGQLLTFKLYADNLVIIHKVDIRCVYTSNNHLNNTFRCTNIVFWARNSSNIVRQCDMFWL